MDYSNAITMEPRYGYFPRWPKDGDQWIHPDDRELFRRLVPSFRIWRRQGTRDSYVLLTYQPHRVRIQPALWVEVAIEGLEVGDAVEVRSRVRQNEYRIAVIREMLWNERSRSIEYHLADRHLWIPGRFRRDDLRPIELLSPMRK